MGFTFCVRGDSFTPRYNADYYLPIGSNHNVAEAAVATDATAIGGSSLDFSTAGSSAQHGKHYASGNNVPPGRPSSVLIRVKFPDLTFGKALWGWGGAYRAGTRGLEAINVTYDSTNFVVSAGNENALTMINNVTFAHGGLTVNTWYDITLTHAGDVSTNALKLYLNNSLLGQATPVRSWANPKRNAHKAITLGYAYNSLNTEILVNEFVIWDEIIDPTANITLESGPGLLNGASRTSFVDVPVFDGSSVGGGGGRVIKTL